MSFCDLLRMTVSLSGGSATILAAITVLAANSKDDVTTLKVAAVWWVIALIAGLILGRPSRAADAMRSVLTEAQTTPTLPTDNPGRVALARLWPLAASTVIAGGLGFVFPGVAAIATGYAVAVALVWRAREGAVAAVEERDGVRFYVEPGSALEPVKLVRTPGLRRDRDPSGQPQLPPTGAA
ncbi:MAG: hypothetical protein EXQ70_02205 [Solirubrobacterales bacterium]|nr:hypothetical protein [Solirubrobacterales bacterium]